MKSNFKNEIQTFGRSLLLPTAVLAPVGMLMGICSAQGLCVLLVINPVLVVPPNRPKDEALLKISRHEKAHSDYHQGLFAIECAVIILIVVLDGYFEYLPY